MSPYTKVAQAAIRLVAFGLALTSAFLYADDLFLLLSNKPPHRRGALALKAVPLLLGAVLLVKSKALARHFTKDLD